VYQLRWIAPELSRIQNQIAHSFDVIKSARSLESTLAEAERTIRNYLITQDRRQLEEHRTLARAAPDQLSALRRLVGEDYPQRVAILDKQVETALAELHRLVETHDHEGAEAARSALRNHLNVDSLGLIGTSIDSIAAAEDRHLASLQLRAAEHERTFAGAALGAGVLALL